MYIMYLRMFSRHRVTMVFRQHDIALPPLEIYLHVHVHEYNGNSLHLLENIRVIVYIRCIQYIQYIMNLRISNQCWSSHTALDVSQPNYSFWIVRRKKSWHHNHNPPQPQKLSSPSSTSTTSALETLSTHHSHFTALNPQSWPPLLTQSLRMFSRYKSPAPPAIPHLPLPHYVDLTNPPSFRNHSERKNLLP